MINLWVFINYFTKWQNLSFTSCQLLSKLYIRCHSKNTWQYFVTFLTLSLVLCDIFYLKLLKPFLDFQLWHKLERTCLLKAILTPIHEFFSKRIQNQCLTKVNTLRDTSPPPVPPWPPPLEQCFSTDGSQPSNGSWKISRGSWNFFQKIQNELKWTNNRIFL